VRVLAAAEKDAPAMENDVILIYHERTQVSTVKSVCGLDAVVRSSSYSSALTNKETKFVTLRLDASATVTLGAVPVLV